MAADPPDLPSPDDVRAAASRIAGTAHRTPVLTSRLTDAEVGAAVVVKPENLQRTGSFKFRGAFHTLSRLTARQRAAGVVAFSSGNHAQAVALAAALLDVPATIVMPTDAPASKLAATRSYGAAVVPYDRYTEDREQIAATLSGERGMTLVPPFDHPDVIAGQGTAALELLEEVPDLGVIVAPVGGGGLISGLSVASSVRVIGAEPLGADDAARSQAAGEWFPQTTPNSIADGLLTSTGQLTWPIIRDRVERIVTVTEAQIVGTMRLVWERMKLVVEPSGVVAAAAVLTDEFKTLGGAAKVGVILSGGNVNLDRLPWM